MDLALSLVEDDLDRDVALAIARHLVLFLNARADSRSSAPPSRRSSPGATLREVQARSRASPGEHSVAALAARANLSPRHFARAFRAEIGITPARYVERVRVEAARRRSEAPPIRSPRSPRAVASAPPRRCDAVSCVPSTSNPPSIAVAFTPAPPSRIRKRKPARAPSPRSRPNERQGVTDMNVAILLYDRFTALDAIGPYEVLSRLPGANVTFVAGAQPRPRRQRQGHADADRRELDRGRHGTGCRPDAVAHHLGERRLRAPCGRPGCFRGGRRRP